jgi:plastocyanin
MRNRYRQWLAVMAVGAAVVTPAAAGASAGHLVAQLTAGGKSAAVAIQTFQFRPTPTEVKAGTQVAWTNNDDIQHTVTSGTPESRDGRFNSTLAGKGATFGVTFSEPGTYPYFCDRHQSMRGEIRVN